jgi:hypothetical protein
VQSKQYGWLSLKTNSRGDDGKPLYLPKKRLFWKFWETFFVFKLTLIILAVPPLQLIQKF